MPLLYKDVARYYAVSQARWKSPKFPCNSWGVRSDIVLCQIRKREWKTCKKPLCCYPFPSLDNRVTCFPRWKMAPSHFRENSSLVIEKKCSNDEIKDSPSVAQICCPNALSQVPVTVRRSQSWVKRGLINEDRSKEKQVTKWERRERQRISEWWNVLQRRTRSSCAQSWSAFFKKGWRLEEALQAQLGKGKLTLRGDGIAPHRHILEVENLTRRG